MHIYYYYSGNRLVHMEYINNKILEILERCFTSVIIYIYIYMGVLNDLLMWSLSVK